MSDNVYRYDGYRYDGYRYWPEDSNVRVYDLQGGGWRVLDPQLHLRNHSPTGFEWGYNGSGPAQLALALLVHAHHGGQNDRALAHYQKFKEEVVSRWSGPTFSITQQEVREWLAQQ